MRIPLKGLIEITNMCNFKCVHCYITNSKKQGQCFLSYDVIKSVIDEVYEMGCEVITISGGECTLHPDFEKIYVYIWKKGIKINIFTNASLISESIISLFKKYIPNCVEVSLYGASESTYKKVTKQASYTNVMNGLKLLQATGINLGIKLIVLKQNEHELEKMRRLACKYTNNPIRTSYDLMPSYDFSLDVLNNHSHIISSAIQKNNSKTKHQVFNCNAGRSFFCINYEANVTLCSFCSFSAMNLREYSFHDIWKSFEKNINLLIPKDSQCYDCTFFNECTNCPARTWMFNQKIGLYPIPQCLKLKNYEGGLFMQTSKIFIPESFVTVNDINYFRLEDGRIAVESVSNITINSSKDDTVELITLEYESKKIRFWKINDKFYALASSSCITLPKDTTFIDYYSSSNYPEGQYVKYMFSNTYGILYISETEISQIISYEKGYTEICFENNLFYANSKYAENKYHVIGESGKLLGVFPSKCKKLDGYMLFYDENNIFIESSKFKIPNGILSVEVIHKGQITFVKVTNVKGIYYYTKDITYLFGPIQNDEIIDINKNSCYVHEVQNKKVFQIFYVKFIDNNYVCKSISCKKGIDIYLLPNIKQHFFATDNSLYVFIEEELKFVTLSKNIDVDEYFLSFNQKKGSNAINIVGFKETKPVYLALYYLDDKKVLSDSTLDFICNGWDSETYICQNSDSIVGITKNGEILFSTLGQKCYKAKLSYSWPDKEIYIIEVKKGELTLYSKSGEKIV